MRLYYSLDAYKDLWRSEVESPTHPTGLARLIRNWADVRKAFVARNILVHGKGRYTRNMAAPHINALLEGVSYIDAYCRSRGVSLERRMPVRRKGRS